MRLPSRCLRHRVAQPESQVCRASLALRQWLSSALLGLVQIPASKSSSLGIKICASTEAPCHSCDRRYTNFVSSEQVCSRDYHWLCSCLVCLNKLNILRSSPAILNIAESCSWWEQQLSHLCKTLDICVKIKKLTNSLCSLRNLCKP